MALEFKETFKKGHRLTLDDIPTILQCKNIHFGHVKWFPHLYSVVLGDNKELLVHVVDNIIDVNVHNDDDVSYSTFLVGILTFGYVATKKYFLDNRCIDNNVFEKCRRYDSVYHGIHRKYSKVSGLVKYLTTVSLNRFIGYYNLDKYQHIINVMLLVMKVQTVLPKNVVRHLIIPFVYQ